MPALDGIRVVDLTRYLSGPTLTMLLADLGAEVIKVESTPSGDPARQSGPFHESESVYYMASNRNKQSLAVDVRSAEGKQILRELLTGADVFVENFRPGTAEAMGLDQETLHALNPKLVCVSVTGFGSSPPGDSMLGFDQIAQAMSGLMSVTGTEETGPLRAGIAVADSATGVFGVVGVLAALLQRERTGQGAQVEASLMESMLSLMSYQAQKYLSLGTVAGQDGNNHPIMFPQGTFATGESGAITLACGNERMWHKLCATLSLDDCVEDARFADNASRMAHRAELRGIIEDALKTRGPQEWIELLGPAGIPCAPVLNLEQALTHPVTESLRMVEKVDHTLLGPMKVLGQPVKVTGSEEDWLHGAPPLLGEHTRDVLAAAGYSPEQVEQWLEQGIVQQSGAPEGGRNNVS